MLSDFLRVFHVIFAGEITNILFNFTNKKFEAYRN